MIPAIHLLQRRLEGTSNRTYLPWLLASAALAVAGMIMRLSH